MEKTKSERKLDESEARYPKQFTCRKCSVTKDAKLFRYIISRAQAEASGYFNHHIHPKKEMSPLCDDCNPNYIKAGKIPLMTKSELEQHLIDNRITRAEFEAEMLLRQNETLRPNKRKQAGQEAAWQAHVARWDWLSERIREDHRRARADVWRREMGLTEEDYDALKLGRMIMDVTALLGKRVTECKKQRMSSTEGVPTLAQMLGRRRTEELTTLWEDYGVEYLTKRNGKGRAKVTPFVVAQLKRMALDGAPAYWTETRPTNTPKESKDE